MPRLGSNQRGSSIVIVYDARTEHESRIRKATHLAGMLAMYYKFPRSTTKIQVVKSLAGMQADFGGRNGAVEVSDRLNAAITSLVSNDTKEDLEDSIRDLLLREIVAPKLESRKGPQPRSLTIALDNRAQIIQHSRIIIHALEEALDFDPKRHHNHPPPDLRIEDPDYLEAIRQLAEELKRLNILLAKRRPPTKKVNSTVVDFRTHANTFLDRFVKVTATGSGLLLIAAIAHVLNLTGEASGLVHEAMARWKP